jgi:hypothetical protein
MLNSLNVPTPPASPKVSPPPTPRSQASSSTMSAVSRPIPQVPVYVNNRVIYVPEYLKPDVCGAVEKIKADYIKILQLNKELILAPDILIALLNHAKYHWHTWLDRMNCEISASERIESLFINNENLSPEESDWVWQIIDDYKGIVERTVSQSNSNPIPPIWMVSSVSSSGSRCCSIM